MRRLGFCVILSAAVLGCSRTPTAPLTATDQARSAAQAFLAAMAKGDHVAARRWSFKGTKDLVQAEIKSNRAGWPEDFKIDECHEVLRVDQFRVHRARFTAKDAAGMLRSREVLVAGGDAGASVLGIMDYDVTVLPPQAPETDPEAPRIDLVEVWGDPSWQTGRSVRVVVGNLKRHIRKGRIDSLDPPQVAASVTYDNEEGPSPTASAPSYHPIPSSPWIVVTLRFTLPENCATKTARIQVTDVLTGNFDDCKITIGDPK